MNLLDETLEILKENKKSLDDIEWIGLSEGWINLEEFLKLIKAGYEYPDFRLILVGDDWWIEYGECDGSEWLEFKTMPIRPDLDKKLTWVVPINSTCCFVAMNKVDPRCPRCGKEQGWLE